MTNIQAPKKPLFKKDEKVLVALTTKEYIGIIKDVWYDGVQYRYEVYVTAGPQRGSWSTAEKNIVKLDP